MSPSPRDCSRPKKNATFVGVLLLLGFTVIVVNTQYLVEKNKILNNMILTGFAFHNFTVNAAFQCFIACVENCLCKSFQIYKNTECQLLSSNQYQSPSALVYKTGYSYYDIVPPKLHQVKSKYSAVCQPTCELLNPCQHGGTHVAVFPGDYTTPRFKCDCLPGYAGDLCQNVVKSCRGYINGRIRSPGKYTVFDKDMKLFEVFCDFNSTKAWTLVQSYQLQNKANFYKSFLSDWAVNEETPRWDSYRLSRSRMLSIQEDSSKFRTTCEYDTEGVVYSDYLQASKTHLDILTYNVNLPPHPCPLLDLIDVRGQRCVNCTAFVHQIHNDNGNDGILHVDSYYSALTGCDFRPTHSASCHGSGEDDFGFYHCINPSHRCASSLMATTQTWLGGHQ